MKKFFDFSFDKMNFLAVIVLILSVVWTKLFHIVNIFENTIYENIAVIPLFLGMVLCAKAKNHRVFFNFIAIILFLVFAREFSYGRVPFCAIEGSNGHAFYQWNHYKYGFLADYVVVAYITFGVLYALINKIWLKAKEAIKIVPVPFWSVFGIFLCVFIQEISEHKFENTVVEEIAEFVIYCLVFTIVYIYFKKLK